MHLFGRDTQGHQRHDDQAHVPHDAGQAYLGPGDGERDLRLPQAAEQHQRHHHAQQRKVGLAVKADGFGVGGGVGLEHLFAPVVVPGVHHEKDGEQGADQEQGLGEDVAHGPEEVHALQEAQEQRRVAQRRERAPGVGDDEDKKHHHMRRVLAVVIGADQRADEQHRRPRGAHDASQHRANSEDGGIERRAAMQVAPDVDAPRHGEQCGEQDDKRNVFGHQRVDKTCARCARAKHQRKRHQKSQRPAGSNLAEVVVPEDRSQQRHQGNRQQNAGKRHTPQHRQRAAINIGRQCQTRQRRQ